MGQGHEVISITIVINDISNAYNDICDTMQDCKSFFSAIINNDNGTFKIKFNISLQAEYNELLLIDYIDLIIANLNSNKTGIVAYYQSSLEANLILYKPLYAKMVEDAHLKWPIYEAEDLYQMCMYTVCKLYKRGYYLHKHLIIKSFRHLIWCEQRQRINKQKDYQVLSLEALTIGKDRDETSAYEIIPDTCYADNIERSENLNYANSILSKLRKILNKNITERQWQQLLHEYGKKQTTNWSRMTVRRIKATLAKKGITKNDLGD